MSRPLLVLHGAGSRGSSHAEFVETAKARRYRVLAPNLPQLDESIVDWVRHVCAPETVLRGSSLGAYLALHAAVLDENIAVVIAIAPTSEGLIRERFGEWGMPVTEWSWLRFLDEHDLFEAVTRIRVPVLYVHARDDERIPLAHSERLHELTAGSELVVVENGGHAGPSHDPAVHELTLDWLDRVLAPR